ncbi:MAG: PD-(D/E)XK nuclease family protein [Bacteroidetes bacterium]|nr:PD-(D/E)XK nuclease family protein [Bacteroidota bacterium]
MERFLSQCAKYIFEKHSDELHNICVVFPNRRSGVFFTSYLQNEISGSVLAPETTTIGELISGYSDLYQGEKLQLVSILYEVFKKHTHTKETFDEFYFWGEILLADFNDIDRYLVNAKDIFTNISDIKEIDLVFDYLTPEQKEALEHFWGSVAVTDRKEFQEKHLAIWEKLYPVYSEFKKILTQKSLAFGGMIDRQVIEDLKEKDFKFNFKKYYIVGLNALNACEKKFFTHLQRLQKAEFLWDFDLAYLQDNKNEAGRFMRENLKNYAPPGDFSFNSEIFNQKKNVKMVAVSSIYGQSQQIPNFLKETESDFSKQFDNTAIVLADESLLFSSLGAIPTDIGTVNITMGYPVKNSMIYGFLMLLVNQLKNKKLDEQRGTIAYHRYVTDILNHQLLGHWETEKGKAFVTEVRLKNRITIELKEINFTDFHTLLFSVPKKVEDYSRYFLDVLGGIYQKLKSAETDNKMLLEIIYSIYQAIEKLEAVVKNVLVEQKQEISEAVYFRLFSQYLSKVSVAFEGEPLSGVQVMGILETRCLDFKNLIILGLNENKWPRKFTAPSFIPFNIRKGFGLPGIDEQDAMYSYYFYRLIQRAKNVTSTYSVVKDGINTGELSRYGFQLQYDSVHKPEMLNLDFSFANEPIKPILIESSKQIVDKLLSKNTLEHPLSPSAINTYLQCSLRFYFRYAVGLPEPDEVKEEIDGMIFGNIFHDTIEALYKPFEGQVLDKSDIEGIQKNKVVIANEITKQIATHYFREKPGRRKKVVLEGKTLLIYENIKTYLSQLLKVDKDIAPWTLVSLEKKYQTSFQVGVNGRPTTIFIGGKIDRVDQLNGTTRVLDYKTGNVKGFSFKTIDELFGRDLKDPKKEILQALIYSWALSEESKNIDIQPAIYSLRKLFEENHSPNIKWDKHNFSFQELEGELVAGLKGLVSEIYSTENTFSQTSHTDKCKYCAYRKICQRF